MVKAPPDVAARPRKLSSCSKQCIMTEHTPEERASLLKQIADAEKQKKIQYSISMAGCYYEIEYVLPKGGGKGGE